MSKWYRVEYKLTIKAKNEWDEDQGYKTVYSATEFNYHDEHLKKDIDKRLMKHCWEEVHRNLSHHIDNEFKLVKVEIVQIYKLIFNSGHKVNGFAIETE